jgi:hypothetical protein
LATAAISSLPPSTTQVCPVAYEAAGDTQFDPRVVDALPGVLQAAPDRAAIPS